MITIALAFALAACGAKPAEETYMKPESATESTTAAEPSTEESTTAEMMLTETTTAEMAADRTTAVPLTLTPAKPFDPADRLEPTREDLQRLEELLKWGSFFAEDYDSENSPVLDYIWAWGGIHLGMQQYDLLIPDENYMERDYAEYIGDDPRGIFGKFCYKKIRADVMEYYMENVFHNSSYVTAREKFRKRYNSDETYCCYYYEDGWYYFYCPHEGMLEEYPKVRQYETQKNGHYLVTIDQMSYFDKNDPPDPILTIQADATLINKDGRRLWTIYSTKIL